MGKKYQCFMHIFLQPFGLLRRCTICDAGQISESSRAGPKDLRGVGFLAARSALSGCRKCR